MKSKPSSTHIFLNIMALLFILSVPASNTWAEKGALNEANQTININSATAEQIAASLNGIGLKKAQAIVQWRTKNGNFTNIEQLTEIKGVGSKILAKNSDLISLQ